MVKYEFPQKRKQNLYFFSEYRNITRTKVVLLFTTKCDPIARIFNKKGKVGTAAILQFYFHIDLR